MPLAPKRYHGVASKPVTPPNLPFAQQVFSKAHAVVLEHDPVAGLRGVQIDIGRNGEIVVTILVVEDLTHMPHMRFFLVGLVQDEVRLRPRIGVQQNLFMRLIVLIQR